MISRNREKAGLSGLGVVLEAAEPFLEEVMGASEPDAVGSRESSGRKPRHGGGDAFGWGALVQLSA